MTERAYSGSGAPPQQCPRDCPMTNNSITKTKHMNNSKHQSLICTSMLSHAPF